jgi:hypothetical protein
MDPRNELNDIYGLYKDTTSALREYFNQILEGDFHNRPDLPLAQVKHVESLLSARHEKIDQTISLTTLAAIESWFRVDFESRLKKREKSSVGRLFKTMHTKKRAHHRARLDDIIQAWSQAEPMAKPAVGSIRSAFKYRDWLADGKYWPPKLGKKYYFHAISQVAEQALGLLGSI